MTSIRYSATTGGFYHDDVHADIPADAVRVSAAAHARLMRAQQDGGRIVPIGARPSIARDDMLPIDEQRHRALQLIDAAARTRILSIASLEQQSNDNAALAIAALSGALSDQASAALDRRTRIEAIRSAAAAARVMIADSDAAALAAFDATAAHLWPTEGDA